MPPSDNDPLELVMTTRIKGGQGIRDAERGVRGYDGAEKEAARTAKDAIGVYERLARARKMLEDAYAGKAGAPSQDRMRDLELNYRTYQRRVDRLSQPEPTRGSMTAKAFLSSRFGKGNGLMPLVGQGLDAVGGAGTAKGVGQLIQGVVDGPLGKVGGMALALARAGYEFVKATYEAADASSKLTQKFTDLRGQIGGSGRDAANSLLMSRITGVDGGAAAKSFQERITSDPLAMGAAGGLGIRNIRSPYGSNSFGPNYQKAIERVSAIGDPSQRRRTALILGIEQEVNRYALLSRSTRQNLGRDAGTTARINSPEAERRASEFSAAQERFTQARENFTTAVGGAFAENFTPFINSFATSLNIVAEGFNVLNEKTKQIQPILSPLVGLSRATSYLQKKNIPATPYEAIGRLLGLGGGGAEGAGNPSLTANTQALQMNNQHLESLNRTLGGGERAQSALPGGLMGKFNRAGTLEGIRLGSL